MCQSGRRAELVAASDSIPLLGSSRCLRRTRGRPIGGKGIGGCSAALFAVYWLSLVVGDEGTVQCFTPAPSCLQHLPVKRLAAASAASRAGQGRSLTCIELLVTKLGRGSEQGNRRAAFGRWYEAAVKKAGSAGGVHRIPPNGGQGAGVKGHRTVVRDTESRIVADHLERLSKGLAGRSLSKDEGISGWGGVTPTGGQLGKASGPETNLANLVSDSDAQSDPDSTSVRFLGGWAETFPSMVDDSRVNSISPVRIPFLLGTQRGARATMAILAPPESMTLYKRIPFLTGTRRPVSTTENPVVGMGEDVMTLDCKNAAVERALSITAKARLELHVYRAKKIMKPGHVPAARAGDERWDADSESVFDQSRLVDGGLEASWGGSCVTLVDARNGPSYAVWAKAGRGGGVSSWCVRADKCEGVVFVGVMEGVEQRQLGGWQRVFARNLGARAWMVGSYGYVCATNKDGQLPLTDMAKKQVGDASDGALRFGSGDLIGLTLDRERGTLEVQLGTKKPFTIPGVAPGATPFVNLSVEGDSVTLCRRGEETADFFMSGVGAGLRQEAAPSAEDGHKPPVSLEELRRIREAADSFWS